jgi:hypothetical protein
MTIRIETYDEIEPAMSRLEELALTINNNVETIVFRGHANEAHRLLNSWQRHRPVPLYPGQDDVDQILEAYKVGLEKLGIESFDPANRFDALEHARHHGVPTPCLDFTYSPYVALFFAFNGVRKLVTVSSSYSIVYGLNISRLALTEAARIGDSAAFPQAFRDFVSCSDSFFDQGFPVGKLQFIAYPGKRNRRMQRQFGCLLYDTQNYQSLDRSDLEDYLERLQEVPTMGEGNKPFFTEQNVLYKLRINHNLASEVFARLELMNINGGQLYGDANGVSLDVINAYNYNSKFGYLRDIKMTPTPG